MGSEIDISNSRPNTRLSLSPSMPRENVSIALKSSETATVEYREHEIRNSIPVDDELKGLEEKEGKPFQADDHKITTTASSLHLYSENETETAVNVNHCSLIVPKESVPVCALPDFVPAPVVIGETQKSCLPTEKSIEDTFEKSVTLPSDRNTETVYQFKNKPSDVVSQFSNGFANSVSTKNEDEQSLSIPVNDCHQKQQNPVLIETGQNTMTKCTPSYQSLDTNTLCMCTSSLLVDEAPTTLVVTSSTYYEGGTQDNAFQTYLSGDLLHNQAPNLLHCPSNARKNYQTVSDTLNDSLQSSSVPFRPKQLNGGTMRSQDERILQYERHPNGMVLDAHSCVEISDETRDIDEDTFRMSETNNHQLFESDEDSQATCGHYNEASMNGSVGAHLGDPHQSQNCNASLRRHPSSLTGSDYERVGTVCRSPAVSLRVQQTSQLLQPCNVTCLETRLPGMTPSQQIAISESKSNVVSNRMGNESSKLDSNTQHNFLEVNSQPRNGDNTLNDGNSELQTDYHQNTSTSDATIVAKRTFRQPSLTASSLQVKLCRKRDKDAQISGVALLASKTNGNLKRVSNIFVESPTRIFDNEASKVSSCTNSTNFNSLDLEQSLLNGDIKSPQTVAASKFKGSTFTSGQKRESEDQTEVNPVNTQGNSSSYSNINKNWKEQQIETKMVHSFATPANSFEQRANGIPNSLAHRDINAYEASPSETRISFVGAGYSPSFPKCNSRLTSSKNVQSANDLILSVPQIREPTNLYVNSNETLLTPTSSWEVNTPITAKPSENSALFFPTSTSTESQNHITNPVQSNEIIPAQNAVAVSNLVQKSCVNSPEGESAKKELHTNPFFPLDPIEHGNKSDISKTSSLTMVNARKDISPLELPGEQESLNGDFNHTSKKLGRSHRVGTRPATMAPSLEISKSA